MANQPDITEAEIRAELEKLESEIEERMEQRVELLRQLAGEEVEDYLLLDSSNDEVRLSELFGEKDDLMLVHNMGRGCSYCTLWADGFNGVSHHLNDRLSFGIVSPNPPEVQQQFAESRDWDIPMYSDRDGDFTSDLGFITEQDGKKYYLPGVSVFQKRDGRIVRTTYDFFGPGDPYAGIWHLLALLPEGANGWHPQISYAEASSHE